MPNLVFSSPHFCLVVGLIMDAFVTRFGRSFSSAPSANSPPSSNVSRQPSIDIYDDGDNDGSDLTSAISGDTPTLPGDEAPSIQAIINAQKASDEAAYDLAVARIPSEHRVKIGRYHYIIYDAYRPRKCQRSAWYWDAKQARELICTTKG